jgi:hypothetical protein
MAGSGHWTAGTPASASPGTGRDFCARNGLEMSPGLDRTSWYQQGIRRAEQDGLIHYARKNTGNQPLVASDDYSHICDDDGTPRLLKYTNTRPLSFIARQILNLYRANADIRFLELGPGAGVACSTVKRLLPDAEIDTVSLTPLNPYLKFLRDDIYVHITEPISREKCLGLYGSCCAPFVRTQYIGKFPQEISPKRQDYHFVYENYGAIFCNLNPDENGDPMELARTSIASALSLLRDDGTMLVMASDGSHRMEDALESTTTGTDVIVTCKRTAAYHSFPCIVTRNRSPLSMRLREDQSGMLSKSERILRLDSQTLERVISEICLIS